MISPLGTTKPIRTGPTGGYGGTRGTVTHYGYDLHGAAGDPVFAPEDMTITDVATDNKTKPLTGYGPGAVQGKGASGFYHVLGHMDPSAWGITVFSDSEAKLPYPGKRYKEGDLLGYIAKDHVHWEMRTVRRPPTGAARKGYTIDPVAYLKTGEGRVMPAPSSGGGGMVLLFLLVLAGRKRRR